MERMEEEMSYTVTNFKTKKAVKEAVKFYNDYTSDPVRCFNPGLGPDLAGFTGKICLEGPHYPQAHSWYAEAWLKDGIVVKVK
jgi:hypothetical protein